MLTLIAKTKCVQRKCLTHIPLSTIPDCDFATPHMTALKRHKLIHTGEMNFECSHCGKKFNKKEALKYHEALHTGAKPFVCDYPDCSMSYPTRVGLYQHVNRIHKGKYKDQYKKK